MAPGPRWRALHLAGPDAVLSAEQLARAEAYAGPARWLGWSSLLVSLVVVCWLGFTEAGARLVGRPWGWWWWCSGWPRVAGRPAGHAALRHRRYRRRVSYGLSTQGWPDWLRDVAVSWAVNVVASSLVLLVIVGTARRWRQVRIAAGIAATLVMLGSFVYPVLVEPLFSSFTPLPDGPCARGCSSWPRPRRARRRRAGGGRLAPDHDAQRLRVGLRQHAAVVLYDNLVRDVPEDQVLGRRP